MSITYAGQALLLETPEVETWLDQYGGYSELRHLCPWLAHPPRINYAREDSTDYLKPRINTLHWPTGAQRWSLFYGLSDTPTKQKIVTKVKAATPQGSELLKLDDGTTSISPRMYLLPPRPLTCRHGTNDEGTLWLISLVDQRYWWQFRNTGNLGTSTADWAGLYNTLAGRLGITLTRDAVDADYLKPDADSVDRKYQSVAALLDAIAHSVGQRIVRRIGTYKSPGATATGDDVTRAINWANSQTDLTDNLKASVTGRWTRSAGDQFDSEPYSAAEKVVVAFRKSLDGKTIEDDFKTYEKTPLAADFPANRLVDGSIKTVRSTALSDQSTNGLGGTPDNDVTLDALAAQISTDYYEGHEKRYDYNFNGVKIWNPTSYNDYVEYAMGSLFGEEEGGGYKVSTRAVSVQPNFGVEFMIHADADNVTDDGGPCCYWIYEAGTTAYNPGPTDVDLDTEGVSQPWAAIKSSGAEVYLDGWACVTFDVSAERSSGASATESTADLQKNGVDVTGTKALLGHPPDGGNVDSASSNSFIQLAAGDLLTINIEVTTGPHPMVTIANTSRLKICPCPGAVLRDSTYDPVGWWPMEGLGTYGGGATQWPELNGTHYLTERTITGGAPVTFDVIAGKVGNALHAYGTDAGDSDETYLGADHHADLAGGQDWTMGAWINVPTGATGILQLFEKDPLGAAVDYVVNVDLDNLKVTATVNRATGSASVDSGASSLTADTWHYVVLTWTESSGTLEVLIDDVSQDSNAGGSGAGNNSGSGDFVTISISEIEQLKVDEMFRYKRVLTAAEQTYLYNGGQGRRPRGL